MAQQQRWILKTQADVASALGTNRNTVASWVPMGMPGRPGNYPLPAIAAWLFTVGPWATEQTRRERLAVYIRRTQEDAEGQGRDNQ